MINITEMWENSGRNLNKTPNKWRKLASTKKFLKKLSISRWPLIKVRHGRDGYTLALKVVADAYQEYLDKDISVPVVVPVEETPPVGHGNLSYNGVAINLADDFISLTDMWKASGLSVHVAPYEWMRLPATKKFMEHLEEVDTGLSRNGQKLVKAKRGGAAQGTYAHWQLAIAYAKYLSPEFHVWANQAIKDRMEEDHDPELGINRSKGRAIEKWQKQGWSESRIAARLAGIDTRNIFTSMLAKHGITGYDFKSATNSTYIALFGGNAKDLRQDRDLPEKTNLRDHMSKVELSAIQLVEAMASEVIEDEGRHGVRDCCRAIVRTGAAVAPVLEKFKKLKVA